jgi:catechol 1,2-dioxygenase
MNDRTSRRQFLRWVGTSSGVGILGLSSLACRHASSTTEVDAGDGDDGGDSSQGGIPDGAEEACSPTGSDIQGPFHQAGAPERTVLAGAEEPGERLVIEGHVWAPGCTSAIAGALLDVWHADENGAYHNGAEYRLRGQMVTDEEGAYRFETIRPGHYPTGGSMRPAHIHFTVSKPGYRSLTTQLYFAGDPHLAPNDPCTSCSSGDPTLIIELERDGEWMRGEFDIVLRKA